MEFNASRQSASLGAKKFKLAVWGSVSKETPHRLDRPYPARDVHNQLANELQHVATPFHP